MTAPKTKEQLEKWLKATTLSERKQKAFIKRYKQEGSWTWDLAENFVGILFESLKTYEDEILQLSHETSQSRKVIDLIEAEIEKRNREELPQVMRVIDEEMREVNDYAKQLSNAYILLNK